MITALIVLAVLFGPALIVGALFVACWAINEMEAEETRRMRG